MGELPILGVGFRGVKHRVEGCGVYTIEFEARATLVSSAILRQGYCACHMLDTLRARISVRRRLRHYMPRVLQRWPPKTWWARRAGSR